MDAGIWRDLIENISTDSASHSFARILSEHIDQGLLLVDTNGLCFYANAAMQEMTGFSFEELLSKPIHDLVHHHYPDGSVFPKEECPLYRACIHGELFVSSEEFLFFRKDGSRFHAHCLVKPIQSNNDLRCILMEVRDESYIKMAALRRLGSQMTYRLAIEAAGIGAWERDLSNDMVTQCPIASEIFGLGYRETVLPFQELQQFIIDEDLPLLEHTLRTALGSEEVFELEIRIRRKNGQLRWINARGMCIKDVFDKPARMVGVLYDITEKKQSDEVLHAREVAYQLAAEAANIGTWEFDYATDNSVISQIAARILGVPSEKTIISAAEWRNRIFSEDKPLIEKAQKESLSTGVPFMVECRLCRPDGSMVWVDLRGISKKDENDRPCKAVGVVIDISEKKRAEENLLQSNQRLSLILESSGEGIYGMEVDHTCTFINSAGAAMLGYEPSELIGQKIYQTLYCSPDDELCMKEQCSLVRAVNHGVTVRDEEALFKTKDGSRLPVAYSVSPIIVDGKPSGAVINFTDITVRKQAEESERQAAAEALASAEANAKFRTFFEQGSHFAGVLALDGTLIEVNRLSLEQCGYTREEVIGKKFWECGWWNRSKAIMKQIRGSCQEAAAGRLVRQEIKYFLADGSERISDLILAPVTDAAGSVLFVAPTGTDITERKQVEKALRAGEERFRLLTELSPDAILVESKGRFVYANPSAARLLGAEENDGILGRKSFDFIEAEFHKLVKEHRALSNEQKQNAPLLELRLKRVDGSIIHAQAACGSILWEGKPAVQIMLRDVTELKQMQDKLHLMNERLQITVEGTGEGIWDWNISNHTFTFSGGLNKILGRAQDNTYGTEAEWLDVIHPEDLHRVRAIFYDSINNETPIYECEYRLRARDGSWKWVKARGMLVERDQNGKPLLMTGTLIDITARKESDEMAWMHANLDALTSLPNRRNFRDKLEHELLTARRNDHRLALLFIDLDGFKQINDLYGHDAGDVLLMEAAHRIKQAVRETDTVARLGGDEFTVILTQLSELDHVEFICQKILTSLAEPFHLGKEVGYVSGSIGISLYPMDAATSNELIRNADQAMYGAKHSGKNQFNYFTKEMDEKAHLYLHMTNELRHALKLKQFEVHYQPVVSLADGQIVKAEALLRWRHPKMGEIEPAQFIPMAEESGLIRQIGNWVFKEATLCCKRCSESLETPFQIGVNKSPIQFMSRDQDVNWLQYLADQDMPENSICVEITEGVLLHASAKVESKLIEYRDAGVEVALDDFGTGYSSMSYLQKFKIDYVKIDQSFVQNITSDPNSRTIAETIIMMAHKLGQKVIAEGIETYEQMECLKMAGCDYGQGFYFSRPISADNLVQMVSSRHERPSWMM